MKRELDELKQHVDSQDKQMAATTRPTTQPAAQNAAAGQSGSPFLFPSAKPLIRR